VSKNPAKAKAIEASDPWAALDNAAALLFADGPDDVARARWHWRTLCLFEDIEKELGVDQAKEIFSRFAYVESKREMELDRNLDLLTLYSELKWPVQKLARALAEHDKQFPGSVGIRARRGSAAAKWPWGFLKKALVERDKQSLGNFGVSAHDRTAGAIERQLKRLLDKKPAKNNPLRPFLERARKVRQDLGFKRGRPTK